MQDVKITGSFKNAQGKTRFTALANNSIKLKTGFGDTEDEAKASAIANLESLKKK